MAKGATLSVAADTRQAMQALQKGIIEPLEDADKILDDLANNRGIDQIEDDMKDASRATDDLRDDIKKLNDNLSDAGRKGGRDLGDGVQKGTRDAEEGLKNLNEEGAQSAKELAASFSGSAEDIAGGLQEVAANAFAGFGPAGAAAGIAAAAGIGIVTAELVKQQEMADELRDRLISAYVSAAEEGRIALSQAEILSNIADVIGDPDAYKAAQEEAKKLGVATTDYLRAISGDEQALNDVRKRGQQELADARTGQEAGYIRELSDLDQINAKLNAVADANQSGQQAAQDYLRAQDDLNQRTEASAGASVRQIERTQAALDAIEDKTIRVGVDTTAYDEFVRKASNGFTVPISPRVAERKVYQ